MQKLLFAKILATIPSKAKKCLSIFQKVHKKSFSSKNASSQYTSDAKEFYTKMFVNISKTLKNEKGFTKTFFSIANLM